MKTGHPHNWRRDNLDMPARLLFFAGFIAVFSGGVSLLTQSLTHGGARDRLLMTLLLTALFAGAMFFVCARRPSLTLPALCMTAVVLMLALCLRAASLDHVTGDYADFLSRWVSTLREGGGFSSISSLQSDYNVPYLYILAIFSYLPFDDLYLIKFVSILADVLLAFAVTSLGRRLDLSENRRLLLLGAVLFTPTVWLNGAFWGQCDSVYALFVILSLLAAVDRRPVMTVAMAALAFSFKLQAVFFFPFLVVLFLWKRIKIRHLPVFPAVYLAVCVPALFVGRPFASLFTIYGRQVGQYSSHLNLNSPSVFAIVSQDAPKEPFFAAGLFAAALFVLYLFYYSLQKAGTSVSGRTLVTLALVFCVGVPWLLPSMHDRYFYLADVLSVLYVMYVPRRWYVAAMTVYASYAGYHAYLMRQNLYLSMWMPALLMGAVIALLLMDFRRSVDAGAGE